MQHSSAVRNDGISYYGVHVNTLPVIAVGYLAGSASVWYLARAFMMMAASKLLTLALVLVGIGLPLLLLTPYNGGATLNLLHTVCGTVVGASEVLVGLFALRHRMNRWVLVGFVVELVGGIIAAASLPDWHFSHLLGGEILLQIGFTVVLLAATEYVVNGPLSLR